MKIRWLGRRARLVLPVALNLSTMHAIQVCVSLSHFPYHSQSPFLLIATILGRQRLPQSRMIITLSGDLSTRLIEAQ
jgi:hypothetical protein